MCKIGEYNCSESEDLFSLILESILLPVHIATHHQGNSELGDSQYSSVDGNLSDQKNGFISFTHNPSLASQTALSTRPTRRMDMHTRI